jgi:hypothetical protein
MPNQVDGALVHAMSGNELSRVRTEFRLRPPEPINQCLLESRGPTLLCNQVVHPHPDPEPRFLEVGKAADRRHRAYNALIRYGHA